MNRTTLSTESLSGLSKALQNMEDYDARGEGFNRAIACERAAHLDLLENPDKLVKFLREMNVVRETNRFTRWLSS